MSKEQEKLADEAALQSRATQLQSNVDPNKVEWGRDDPENPRNWSMSTKCWITAQLSTLAMAASMGSSITAPANGAIASYTHISNEAAILNVSLYVMGFALGPLLWGPMSELWGRRISLIPAMFCLGVFSIGTAVSKNATSIFVTRFFAGVFGSSPVSNVSPALGDIWEPKVRGTAVTFYAVAVVGGPCLGPIIGAGVTTSPGVGWRWTEYLEAIFAFITATITFFCLPEMYAPVLLRQKAQRLRKETGNQALYSPHDDHKLTVKSIFTQHLSRPLVMLTTEPMVTSIAVYASFVYGLLYFTLEAFPIVFEDDRGMTPVIGSLSFLSLFIGVLCAVGVNLANQPRYARLVDAAKGRPVPEGRLAPMAIGGVIFAIGLFLFGWTANPKIHWIAPIIAALLIGAGFNIIFQQCINFLVDTYQLYAASAVSANTFLRSFIAAGLPFAAKPMFHNLGAGPGMSILGGIATLAIPVPFIFMKYGVALRKMSKFAPVDES